MSFSETWAHKDIADSELEIPGYKLFGRDRGNKGGGLAVYVRNNVSVMVAPTLKNRLSRVSGSKFAHRNRVAF